MTSTNYGGFNYTVTGKRGLWTARCDELDLARQAKSKGMASQRLRFAIEERIQASAKAAS